MTTLYKYTTGGRDVLFTDKEDTYDAETIRKHWAQTFPELANAQAEIDAKKQTVTDENGQQVEINKVISFVKKVGTKGSGSHANGSGQPDLILNLYRVRGKLGIGEVLFAVCDLWVEAWTETDAIGVAKDVLDRDPTYKIGWTEGPAVELLGPAASGESLVERLRQLVGDEALAEVRAGGGVYGQIGPLLFKHLAPDDAHQVLKFTYDGFYGQELDGLAPYTAKFVRWTNDPGVAVCDCSDGQRRLIPTFALADFDKGNYPEQPKTGVMFGQAAAWDMYLPEAA